MAEPKISIDELARLIQENVVAKMATKEDIDGARAEIRGTHSALQGVELRLDRIENLLLRDHLTRIERLEDSMHRVKSKVGID